MLFQAVSLIDSDAFPLTPTKIAQIDGSPPPVVNHNVKPVRIGNLVFPPYDFGFSVEIGRDGTIRSNDDLDPDATLVCQRRDYEGQRIAYEPEREAIVWTFLRCTQRRVINRPSDDELFRPALLPKLSAILASCGAELETFRGPVTGRMIATGFFTCRGFFGDTQHTQIRVELDRLCNMIGTVLTDDFLYCIANINAGGRLTLLLQTDFPEIAFRNYRTNLVSTYQ
jgi:hypothetical protein